jgi:hypothetical protein
MKNKLSNLVRFSRVVFDCCFQLAAAFALIISVSSTMNAQNKIVASPNGRLKIKI